MRKIKYLIGMNGKDRVEAYTSTFTLPLYGVPVQISGRGFVAIRRFLKFQNRAERHAKKLTDALNDAAEAARNASVYFYMSEVPMGVGKEKEPPKETAPMCGDD